ncbi:MAG: ATP-binding cassette domain-containing protein [Actinomycetota bacterium]|nr:ATP-binding cassette domain-containing protein [Actinomycetota bacterium]
MSAAVEVQDLFRVHPQDGTGVAALQGLTLAVEQGEICVVLGPSGSGKTTLLRILAALDRPSAGRVRVFGVDVAALAPRARAGYRARTVGYAEQRYWQALAEELPAREVVALPLALAGAGRRERRTRADALLERVGLGARADALPRELSGGEQQRVAICAALAPRPRLFLADEPTGELDAANAAAVFELIRELVREEGSTALVVSHDPTSATIADRVVRVRDGRVSEEATRSVGAEEAIVVGKGGWLRLSEELLRNAGIGSRASARAASGGIVVTAAASLDGGAAENGDGAPARERRSLAASGAVAELGALVKRYGSEGRATTVLDGLTTTFPAGRLVAVTGPSGSGKTTLLHLLAGLDLPSSGRVVVAGTDLSTLDRTGRALFRREHLALVGQEAGLVPFLTVRENVEVALALREVPPEEAARRAREALAAVGLGERAEQPASRLSSGESERAAIARALAVRPALLLADEPTARLDRANALAVSALLAQAAHESGAAVVCATHDPLVIEQADEELALRRPEGASSRPSAPRGRARARGSSRRG